MKSRSEDPDKSGREARRREKGEASERGGELKNTLPHILTHPLPLFLLAPTKLDTAQLFRNGISRLTLLMCIHIALRPDESGGRWQIF